jgi:hypothetical protein
VTRADRKAEKRMKSVEAQLELIERRQLDRFECPYCGGSTKADGSQLFCCDKLYRCVSAIVDRRNMEDAKEGAERALAEAVKQQPLVTLN